MSAAADDWRRVGQEKYLPPGTAFVRKRYRAFSATWEHDHCQFCWATLMDPDFSPAHRRQVEEHAEVLTEGYATTEEHARGADCHWVCPACFDDFALELGWRVVSNS
jgi:hypothetical protein